MYQQGFLKKSKKDLREHLVLMGLIDLYLKTGKPVGSNTLKEEGFEDLSSATIRNYFARLEEEGYLKQQHSSGGRIPTERSYRLYAEEHRKKGLVTEAEEQTLRALRQKETKEIAGHLHQAAEILSQLTGYAIFLSAPRFDHDFILNIKLVEIDENRCLCVVITDFGLIQPETIYVNQKLSAHALKRLELYFHSRLTHQDKPESLSIEEEKLGEQIYNEIMMRYLARYANFSREDIYCTGFSRLLAYEDFQDANTLSHALSLFENREKMIALLEKGSRSANLNFWIGEDLKPYLPNCSDCSVVTIPYHINQTVIGAVGVLGPARMLYREVFGKLQLFSDYLSESLTKSLYKFKLSFRQPAAGTILLDQEGKILLGHSPERVLIENHPTNKISHQESK